MHNFFVGLLLFGFLSCTAQPSISSNNSSTLIADVVKETNLFRKSNNLPVLIPNKELNELAQAHSNNMASGRVAFSHAGFDARSKKARKVLTEAKGGFAENVAYGSKTAKEVLNGWQNSPGHRKNILGNYKYIGVGIAADSKGRLYFTQIFVN